MMTLCEMTTCKTTFLAIMKHDSDGQKKHIDMHKHIFSIFAATVAFEVLELLKLTDLPESVLLKVNRLSINT